MVPPVVAHDTARGRENSCSATLSEALRLRTPGGLGIIEGQSNDPRRQRAGGGNARQPVAGWRQGRLFEVGVRLEPAVQIGCRVALQVVAPKPPEARLVAHVVQGAAVMREAVRAAALLPGRLPHVGAIGRQHAVTVIVQVVQVNIAPARGVGHVGQMAAIRRKRRLKDSHRFTAGQRPHVRQTGSAVAAGLHRRHLEQRALPRHLRMLPLHPGEPVSLRVPARLHVEIRARCQFLRPRLPRGIHDGQAIHILIRVHEDHPAAVRRHRWRRGVPECRRQRLCRSAGQGLPVQPPAGLAEIDPTARDAKIAAAVADPRPHRQRRQIPRRLLARRQAHQHPPVRAPLQPHQGLAVAVPRHVRQP